MSSTSTYPPDASPLRVYLDTVGCRLNHAEIEAYARQFRMAGHSVVASAAEADLVVMNTCAVTAEAASDSRQKIRQAAQAGDAKIVVTGCWSTLEPEKATLLPQVSRVIPNVEKDLLVPQLLGYNPENFDREPVERDITRGARLRTRAFIKIQDGCDNRCTFCVTTIARGAGRSLPITAVLQDIGTALAGGAQEIVLTGVHLGSWGHDFANPDSLQTLISAILAETDPPRLRLSSLEPWDLNESFFSLWKDERLCRQLHLPLQSGSDTTLRRMARRTNQRSFAALVQAARDTAPEIAITTDVIVGFPGELVADFEESLAFVREMEFAGGHVFSYSARPGTAAARFPGQVSRADKKARSNDMREIISSSADRYRRRFLNSTLSVLWESATALDTVGWTLSGLSDNYIRVQARAPQKLWNTITPVYVTGLEEEGLSGAIVVD